MPFIQSLLPYLCTLLLVSAFAWIQCMVGGTRLLFALPAYGLVAVAGLLSILCVTRKGPKPRLFCLFSAALFTGYVIWRCAASPYYILAREDFYSVIGCFAVYLLTAFYITTTRQRSLVIVTFCLLALVNVFVGLIQFTQGNEFMLFGFIRPPSDTRASGMFISGNHFAGFLEVVAVMGISIAIWSRWRLWAKMLLAWVALCCFAGVAISGSRGGYLSTIFSLLVCGILSLYVARKAYPERFVALAFVMAAGIALFVGSAFLLMSQNPLLQQRMGALFQKNIRVYNWMAAMDQIRLSPWIGTGAGTHLYYGRLFRRIQIQSDPVHAHSDYLEILAEYGVAGFAAMLLFVGSHIGSGIAATRIFANQHIHSGPFARSNRLAVTIGTLSAMGAYVIHSIVDFNLHIPGNAMVFAFFFGILANPGLESSVRPGRTGQILRLGFQFSLPGIALFLWIWTGMRLAKGAPWFSCRVYEGEKWTELSRIALRNREFASCVDLGQKALEYEKGNFRTYFYIGEAQRVQGLTIGKFNRLIKTTYLERAVNSYSDGLKLLPMDENLLLRKAQALDALGRFDEAENVFQDVLKWDPNLGVLHGYYGAHLLAEGKKEESAAEYRKGQEMTSESITHLGQPELGNVGF